MIGVLLQVDPSQAIDIAKTLGSATPQTILAFLCMALSICFGWAMWRLIAEIKSCGAERTDLLGKNIDAQHRMSDALDRNSDTLKAALDTLKSR